MVFSVITLYNSYNKPDFDAAYTQLFSKAYDKLKAAGKLSQEEQDIGYFTSLDSYFAHMADLIDINPNYALLPLDEDPLEIKANSRKIDVPTASFGKCAGIEHDNVCEIVTFTVDRYYDYVDLDTAYIAVQWINALKEPGISYIRLKDLDTYPGKIRFGWPLTSDITKAAGDVEFAVRFYLREGVNAEENPDAAKSEYKIKYILNTEKAKLPIKAGLNIEDPMFEEENVPSLFASFVRNSINPTGVRPEPVFFVHPGLDLEAYGAIGADNTLVLKAQAVASDSGAISYIWKYQNDNGEIVAITNDTPGYAVNHDVFEKIEWPVDEEGKPIKQRVGSEKYWYVSNPPAEDEELTVDAFSLYAQAVFNDSTPDLYERFTVLTIEDTENVITGKYWVEATNTIAPNSTNPEMSTKCNVPAPAEMNIEKDLVDHMFLAKNAEGSFSAQLKVALNKDTAKPKYDYKWRVATDAEPTDVKAMAIAENGTTIGSTKNENEFGVGVPGWYAVTIDASLNRTSKDMKSNICKVTDVPKAPVITKLMWHIQGEENWNEVEGSSVDINQARGDVIDLKIVTDLDNDNGLKSEELSYVWSVLPVDGEERTLVAKDIEENGLLAVGTELGTAQITVNPVYQGSAAEGERKGYTYFCIVTNKIQNKTESAEIEGFFVY